MGDLPLTASELERFRLRARSRMRPARVGTHVARRQGLGLDFRELSSYQPGDDIRHVEWRASLRHGRPEDWLVRTFHAEEQLTLAISVDPRASMRLPSAAPKLRVASWIAEALARIASSSEDRVLLHRLFGPPEGSVLEVRAREVERVARFARDIAESEVERETPNFTAALRRLPPAAAWIIISDFYFPDEEQEFRRALRQARDGWRWIILVELDSWPHEELSLGRGARRLKGPGLPEATRLADIDDQTLASVRSRVERHVGELMEPARHGDVEGDTWSWPRVERPDLPEFFRETFLADRHLQRLFMRDS